MKLNVWKGLSMEENSVRDRIIIFGKFLSFMSLQQAKGTGNREISWTREKQKMLFPIEPPFKVTYVVSHRNGEGAIC
jgi:hypothetical protein